MKTNIYNFAFELFLFLSLFLSHTVFGQSGWTKQKGEIFSKLDFASFSSDSYYNPLGEKLKTTLFKQKAINLYAEYGVSDRFTVITSVPLLRINRFETTESVAGFGDLKVELKYKLTKKNQIPIAISIAPEFPTGRANAFAKNITNPFEKINLPTGDGEFNISSTFAVSLPFNEKVYLSLYTTYNKRTTYNSLKFVDLYQFGGEIGVNPYKGLWFNAKLRSQHAVKKAIQPELSFVRGDGTTYTLLAIEGFYKITPKWGFSLTYFTGGDWIAKPHNIYINKFGSVGIIYEIKK